MGSGIPNPSASLEQAETVLNPAQQHKQGNRTAFNPRPDEGEAAAGRTLVDGCNDTNTAVHSTKARKIKGENSRRDVMDHKTLKNMRLFMPIFLFALMAWPISQYIPTLNIQLIDTPIFKAPAFSIIAGLIYSAIPVRQISNRMYFDRVGENIAARMWIYGKPSDPRPPNWNWSTAKRAFYPLVDKDPLLATKTANVYFNGLIWTTIADARAIAILCWLALLIARILQGSKLGEIWWLAGLPAIAISSFIFSEISTRKHINLSNDQIEHIAINNRQELTDKINNSLSIS